MTYPPPMLVRASASRAVWIRRIVLVGTLLSVVTLTGTMWLVKSGSLPPALFQ